MNEETVKPTNRSTVKEIFRSSTQNIESKLKTLNMPPFLKKKKVLIPAAIAALLIVIVVIISFIPEELNLPSYTVKKGNFLVSITESGELRAKQSVSIAAPRVRGTLKIVHLIPEGTYVKAGDIVVKFDPTEALNNLKESESRLEIATSDRDKLMAQHRSQEAQMESDLKTAELTYELSKLSLEQMKFEAEAKQQEAKLQHQKNELSYLKTKKDIESKKIILKSEMNRAEIEIRQREQDLQRAKNDLEMLTLIAPTEGLVVYEPNWGNSGRKFNIGDVTWGGSTISTLPDLSTMESITYVNEVDVSNVKKGQKVEIKLDAFQDSTFEGVVSDVASLGRSKDNNSPIKVFEILVSINQQSSILKPGMTTSNKIIINQIPDVVSIPMEAVFEKYGKKIIYVKNGSGFDERQIETADKSENFIIVKKGLENGEIVALRDPSTVEDSEETSDASVNMPAR